MSHSMLAIDECSRNHSLHATQPTFLPASASAAAWLLHQPHLLVWGCRSTSEVGGLWPGQNVSRYGRQHLQSTWLLPLSEAAALALTGEAGLLLPLAARPWAGKATCITDRCAETMPAICAAQHAGTGRSLRDAAYNFACARHCTLFQLTDTAYKLATRIASLLACFV